MKRVTIERLMLRYVCCVGVAILLLAGGMLLLESCEKEVPDGESGSGKMVEVRFLVDKASYGEGLRNADMHQESETVLVPVEGDLYMYATLEPVEESPVRATAGFVVGAKLMIAAYKVDPYGVIEPTAFRFAKYKITSNSIEPEDSSDPLHLPEGFYYFAAYSYNDPTLLLSEPNIIEGDPSSDLLWGISKLTALRPDDPTVQINLKHMFSKVTVSATTENPLDTYPPSITLLDVKINPGYKVNMDVRDGGLTKIESVIQSVDEDVPTLPTPTKWKSVPRMVYTAGETPLTISIASVTLTGANGSNPMGNMTAAFAMSLLPGMQYNLSIAFKPVVFAGNNVYWDNDNKRLTFDPPYVNVTYQGVFFKWGSLVGISGTKENASEAIQIGKAGKEDGNPIYLPNTMTNMASQGWNNWTAIPYFNAGTTTYGRSNTFLNDPAQNTLDSWNGYRGDICQKINPAYRMPTSYEFGAASAKYSYNASSWVRKGADSDFTTNLTKGSSDGHGTRIHSGALTYRSTSDNLVNFPASGRRSTAGKLEVVCSEGCYWSSSAYSQTHGYALSFDKTGVNPAAAYNREMAFPVRCVKKN